MSVDPDDLTDSQDPLLREGLPPDETDDPLVASDEGMPYVAPIDPPIAGEEQGGDPRIAAGFGSTGRDEPFDADHHRSGRDGDDEVTARIREALLADSLGSQYVDRLRISSAGDVAQIEGEIDDLDIEDHLIGVVAAVEGVNEVRNRLFLPEGESGDDRGG